MSESIKPPRVRPAFRWLAGFAFLLGLLMAVVAGWDYVETSAFRKALDEVRAKGEPVTLRGIRPRPASEEGQAADRLFRAAVVLATWTPEEQRLFNRVREASRSGEWPDDLAASARRYIGQRGDALQLLDRAAPMKFEGLSLGGESTSAALFQLARLAAMRTSLQIFDRDDAHIVDALYAELRYRPVIDWAWGLFRGSIGEVERVGSVLSATHPPSPALARIAQALADFDRDDAPKRWFLRQRAGILDSMFPRGTSFLESGFGPRVGFGERLARLPFQRATRKRFETMAGIIAALDQPWPMRAGAIAALYDSGAIASTYGAQPTVVARDRSADIVMSNLIVDDLALVRVSRAAVAIEQYRREHHEMLPGRLDDLVPAYLTAVPVDPYSGWPLLFRTEARTYTVYSLGPNRRDDNGDLTLLRFVEGGRQLRDIGVRIQFR